VSVNQSGTGGGHGRSAFTTRSANGQVGAFKSAAALSPLDPTGGGNRYESLAERGRHDGGVQ
jgi:hypothetical protein